MQVILTMVFVKETRWMATLEELRGQLDVVDDQIVKLYEERMKICEQVGEYKVEAGRKVFDRVREKEKLQNVASKVSSDFDKKGIQELYQQLMSMSRKLQYQQLVKAGALGRLPFIERGESESRISGHGRCLWTGSYEDLFRRGLQQLFRPYIPGCNGSNRGGRRRLCSASNRKFYSRCGKRSL